ncbi:uncharacterized protein [Polyergus mexicanus]|uniref:uncharacterized protein n=1 Tax=Polyergus mexicanus TaxID=615972 RepID=UPI0038B4AB70
MSNVKNTINCINKHKYKIKESKMTSKGRHIIKPKKLLTTSSDEKRKTKKRIIKRICTDMCEELYDLQSSAAHPNILRDITFPNNMHKSKIQRVTSEISHDANHVLSRSISMDTSLSPNNHKQSVTYDTSHALSRNLTEDLNMSSNDHNLKLPHNEYTFISLDVEQIPIVFHNDLQESAKSSNDTIQCEIIKLLSQVVEQNSIILSDIKVLKEHHTLTMRNNLYKRTDGFPLKTVKEFKELETDTDRLQELLTYLQFVGGIKLREALSHFQKETMTDELTCKFTYWGRTKESLAFYNTQIAKVFFYAAKRCPHFKRPETRAEFKLEIMEVFRAAKQRQYLRSTKDKRTAETEEMCSEDAVSNDHFDTDGIFETEDPDASDESD